MKTKSVCDRQFPRMSYAMPRKHICNILWETFADEKEKRFFKQTTRN